MSRGQSELRITALQVRDVLGVHEAAIEPGKITIIKGRNGSTKTSILTALQAALGGGKGKGVNLMTLARVPSAEGEEVSPEVVLVLQGPGSEEYRVERRGEDLRVRARVANSAAFEDVGSPATWLRGLVDAGFNPAAFLAAADKDRALMLLEALPLQLDRDALAEALAEVDAGVVPPIPRGLHPLEEIEMIRGAVFGARTGVNRDQKGKAQAADQTRRNAPAALPEDPATAIATAEKDVTFLAGAVAQAEERAKADERAALVAAQETRNAAVAAIQAENREAIRSRKADHEAWAAVRRAAVEREIADAAANLETAILDPIRAANEARLDAAEDALAAATASARQAREAAEAALQSNRAELAAAQERLATLREQAKTAASARALHDQAKRFEEESVALLAKSEALTRSLERLDALRRRLASDLPIEGLSIEDKVIRVHSVPFQQLNTAQQIEIAVQVSCLRARNTRLPLALIDGAERLDRERLDALLTRLREEGMQAFVTLVANQDLQVEAFA